jgi:hypothetical protein
MHVLHMSKFCFLKTLFKFAYTPTLLILVAARSKAWFCGLFLAGTASSNSAGDIDVSCECLCCQVEVSARGRSLVQRSLPSVSVIVRPRQWGDPSPIEIVKPGKNTSTYWWSAAYFTRLSVFQIMHCSIEWDNCILLNKKCLNLGFLVPCIFKYSNKTLNQMQQSVVKFIA